MTQHYGVLAPRELILELQSAKPQNSFVHTLAFCASLIGAFDGCPQQKTSGRDRRAIRAARSACRELLLTRTNSTKKDQFRPKFKQHWIDDGALIRRLRRPWVRQMLRDFIEPLGGLVKVLSSPTLGTFDALWSRDLEARRGELAIVEYLAKGFVEDRALVDKTKIVRIAMRIDALQKGSDFYRVLGEKRKRRLTENTNSNGAEAIPLYGMSDSQFHTKWKRVGGRTLTMFLINDFMLRLSSDGRFFSDPKLLEDWSRSSRLRDELATRLQLVDALCLGIPKLGWQNVPYLPCVSSGDSFASAPRFTTSQREAALQAFRWSKPNRRKPQR